MAAGNGVLPSLGTMIGSAETALARLYELRAQADATGDDELSKRLGVRISELSTSVMRLKIERVGIVEADLQALTSALKTVAASAEASLQNILQVETTLSSIADFLKIADKVIARVTTL
jgi:hypothetical protein